MPSIANRWMVGMSLPILAAAQARGEDQVGFAHETYVEDHGRMTVNTETLRVQLTLSPWLDVTARGVYDAISGATPTGARRSTSSRCAGRSRTRRSPIPPSPDSPG